MFQYFRNKISVKSIKSQREREYAHTLMRTHTYIAYKVRMGTESECAWIHNVHGFIMCMDMEYRMEMDMECG